MLIALPVLPLEASTMVSPGRSSPSRSARAMMYSAIRALIDPEGLRYSSFTHTSSMRSSGVSPMASRIVSPPLTRSSRRPAIGLSSLRHLSQASTLSGLASTHFLAASSGVHPVLGDVLRHRVLVVVGPLEVLHQVVGRAAGLGELRARRSCSGRTPGSRRRPSPGRRRSPSLYGGRFDLDQRDLGHEPLRLVEVADQRLLVRLGLAERLDQRGLAAGVHHLVVQLRGSSPAPRRW